MDNAPIPRPQPSPCPRPSFARPTAELGLERLRPQLGSAAVAVRRLGERAAPAERLLADAQVRTSCGLLGA